MTPEQAHQRETNRLIYQAEYRQDDENAGYCPQCGEQLSALTNDARGFCELHGWQWANWGRSDD